jgi:nucleoside-diphosphate-sugar epimerase
VNDNPAIAIPAHVRRLFPVADWVTRALASDRLGAVRTVRWEEGTPFTWPVTSPFTFGPVPSGGGLLHDLGPHVLDLLGHWLGGPADIVSVAHNGLGGTETEVELRISIAGVPISISLSRLRRLDNTLVIEGEHRTLRVGTERAARYVEHDPDGRVLAQGEVPADPPTLRTRVGLFREQLVEFQRAIAYGPSRLPRLADTCRVTRLIEECHSLKADPLPRPWRSPRAARPLRVPAHVAVTGAAGFIGANTVEGLIERNSEIAVTAIGHSLPTFARLAHLDHRRIRYHGLDVRDTDALRAAFTGNEVVVHAAYGNSGTERQRSSITVDGTAAVVEAAKTAGVRRLILLSSMAVYDTKEAITLKEDSPRLTYQPHDYSYAQQKLAAERIVLANADESLEAICLQPGVVYGPWGPKWTVRALTTLRADNYSLPSGPAGGICNAVHVLDVAAAIGFLISVDEVDGQCFLLCGPQQESWGTFYDHYRAMLGLPNHGMADHAEWPDSLRHYYAEQATISTQRLSSVGFQPTIDLQTGMDHVASWASWAGLV